MTEPTLIKSAVVVDEAQAKTATRGPAHVVSLEEGVPVALDGVTPVISIAITDAERDAVRLLRAAEQLLPRYRQVPGVVVLDEAGNVRGVIARDDLEEAVLRMRRGQFTAFAKGMGLRGDYRPPAGDMVAPFLCWQCPDPECGHIYVPTVAREQDTPHQCQRHDPPVQMERRIHPGK
jgi:hypothetical protein